MCSLQNYLKGPLNESVRLYGKSVRIMLELVQGHAAMLLALYFVAMILHYMFVLRPLIFKLDNEGIHFRTLLLLIPEASMDQLRDFRKFILTEYGNAVLPNS